MKPLISASNLSYKINEKKLFQNISFDVNSGKALHISGSNGSGKTTLLRIIVGLSKPTKGSVEIVTDKSICFLGHKNALKQYLTVEDNLHLHDINNHIHLKKYLVELGLEKSLDVMVANLSFGQQKKLALLRIFLNDSQLIILDEPCVGLDAVSQDILCFFLRNEIDKGKSIIFSSHIALDIEASQLNLNN